MALFNHIPKKLRIRIYEENIPVEEYLVGAVANGKFLRRG